MAELSSDKATLTTVTGDAFKSSYLERMLIAKNCTTSYKLYWMRGIFDEVIAGNEQIPLRRLTARMVSKAWYPVTYFRLRLGKDDRIAETTARAKKACGLSDDASEEEIVEALLASNDELLSKSLQDRCRYVQSRMIRPFYEDQLAKERKKLGLTSRSFDSKINHLIIEYNRQDTAGAPYRFLIGNDAIEVDGNWAKYFRDNQHVISGWLDLQLINYLQARNPSVPAIPLKIRPPKQRNLREAKRWWSDVQSDHVIYDIYSGKQFTVENCNLYGPLSLDHFIPWSFVLHDEPWNLIPMFRNMNSSKSDMLPQIDDYIQPFCDQQFDALMTMKEKGRYKHHRSVIDSYISIDSLILVYDRSDEARATFSKSISQVIMPLYQIALNQGFPIWNGV